MGGGGGGILGGVSRWKGDDEGREMYTYMIRR